MRIKNLKIQMLAGNSLNSFLNASLEENLNLDSLVWVLTLEKNRNENKEYFNLNFVMTYLTLGPHHRLT